MVRIGADRSSTSYPGKGAGSSPARQLAVQRTGHAPNGGFGGPDRAAPAAGRHAPPRGSRAMRGSRPARCGTKRPNGWSIAQCAVL